MTKPTSPQGRAGLTRRTAAGPVAKRRGRLSAPAALPVTAKAVHARIGAFVDGLLARAVPGQGLFSSRFETLEASHV